MRDVSETLPNKRAWERDLRDLTEVLNDAEPDSRASTHARGVIEARAAVASRDMATWTKRLAIATFLLALTTVVLAVITAAKT